ncbi:hypothetical protein Bca52824_080049 [Brassica carinata]|uniref:Uncharacterized protein n=1 Tax=Brassica carinata TaxID=52824 RepID=A0A8X7Q172_BRACI|nr:hypothetical protein Bca52824_080049 [Brassica carinata]
MLSFGRDGRTGEADEDTVIAAPVILDGAWHEGRKQGYGDYSFRTGDAKSGEWDSGSLVNPLHPTSYPVRRAVQAARETAKKAVNRRRVDEQVSRAVAAANKAATAARVAAVKAVQNQMDEVFNIEISIFIISFDNNLYIEEDEDGVFCFCKSTAL